MSISLSYRVPAALARPRGSMRRFFFENNPFYLLSAACMLLGLMTLTNSLSFSPIPQYRLIVLIATLSLYETVLIALAVWLIDRRNIMRDAEILLAIEALFLADGAMLGSEMFMANLALGALVNLMLLMLAGVKLAAVMWALRLPLARTLPPILGQLAILLFLPGWFKAVANAHGGQLPPITLYGGWWLLAVFPLLTWLTWRGATDPARPWEHRSQMYPRRRIAVTFSAMSGVSLFVHLAMASWVYQVHFWPAFLAPLALGVALAAEAASPVRGAIDIVRMRIVKLAPMLAIVMSVQAPVPLTTEHLIPISTLRLALFGAACIWAIAFVIHRNNRWALASMASLFIAMLGATVADIFDNLTAPLRTLADHGESILPQTASGWGLIAVISAFALLAAGAILSIQKKPPELPGPTEEFSVALRESDARRQARSLYELAHGPRA